MSNVRRFIGGKILDKDSHDEIIKVAESLVADLKAGTVTDFMCVAVDASKTSMYYVGCHETFTKMDMVGAIAMFMYNTIQKANDD